MALRTTPPGDLPASKTGFGAAPGVLLLLSCLLTAIVAHTQAGGSSPGPGGALVTALVLAPMAVAVNRRACGLVAFTLAGLLGQLAAHVSLSIVTPAHHMPGHTTSVPSASAGHTLHHHPPVAAGPTGWSLHEAVLGHLLHMGAGMAFAHVLGAVITALLVTATLRGLRRAAGRALIFVLHVARNPVAPPCTRPRELQARRPRAPFLVVLAGRAPPLLS